MEIRVIAQLEFRMLPTNMKGFPVVQWSMQLKHWTDFVTTSCETI